MSKAAVSLISLEPSLNSQNGGAAPLGEAHASRGLLAALVYDSLGDLLSQIQDGFQPVHLNRATTAQETVALVEQADTALLFGEVSEPDHAFQLLLALKFLKDRIASGQVRVIVNCTLPSKTLVEKLHALGCTEIISDLSQPEQVVQKARMLAELLLFRRAVARLPGGKVTAIGLAFLLTEWISQQGMDYPSLAHLFCACLSAACGGARFEFHRRTTEGWECAATSDGSPAQWQEQVKTEAKSSAEVRIEWIGNREGALLCSPREPLTAEQDRLVQAAVELSRDFVLLDASANQANSALKRSGLKY